jgi:hypothetical protein
MLAEKDFIWHERHENNISTNPLGEYYCIVDFGDGARKYAIRPQYPSKDGVVIDRTSDPELFILFEATGRRATDEDKSYPFYSSVHCNDYLFHHESFIRAFKTMEEAKARAYVQYRAIFGYVLSHMNQDIDEATKQHFCVE